MICYQLDVDGYLMSATLATRDPEESRIAGKDVWAIPGGCVTKAPPGQQNDCRLRWLDGRWINEPEPDLQPDDHPDVAPIEPLSAVAKLALFLRQNPDVSALIGGEQ